MTYDDLDRLTQIGWAFTGLSSTSSPVEVPTPYVGLAYTADNELWGG